MSNPQVVNCTFDQCYARSAGGTFFLHAASNPTIVNTIVAGTINGGGVYINSSPNASLTYCDFYNNTGGNFPGVPRPGLGTLTAVNANGDSCDTYMNIYLDPRFVNPGAGDYYLQASSPCIDAGDPAAPLDPDSTVADIGAFYFDQSGATPLVLTLTPHNPPIQIPASGGSFTLDAAIENTTQDPITFDAWTEAVLPSGGVYGPIILRTGLVIPPGATILRVLTQNVPGYAPSGNYTYVGKAGTHPGVVIDFDEFPFTKLQGDGIQTHNQDWECYGWDDENEFSILNSQFLILSSSPNPFNSSTALSFELQAASQIKLAVYDISGREVALLAQGYHPAGTYQVEWDASKTASGVYFARLADGSLSRTQKLLLIK